MFYYRPNGSSLLNELDEKFIILSVAFNWNYSKGLDRLERLADILDDRYRIVIVGIEKSKVNSEKIICIPRTDNQVQLAELYSSADILLNTTRADTFPTVNIEALSCGLPVLSYGAGGSAEAFDNNSGLVVNDDNIVEVIDRLYFRNFDRMSCIKRAKNFKKEVCFSDYVNLYNDIIS